MTSKELLIKRFCLELDLTAFANYKETLQHMQPNNTYEDMLIELLRAEIAFKAEAKIQKGLKAAGFPYYKSLDEFDMRYLNKSISPEFIYELGTCDFVDKGKNIVMIGNPGRGKTHLAIALGMKACSAGKKVLYKNAASLSTELTEARSANVLGKLQKNLDRTDLLILDELSYISFNRAESDLLFQVISKRTEIGSTIITTNLPFSRWNELFDDTGTMIAALIDRLTYKSYVLDMNGDSYRLMKMREATETAAEEAAAAAARGQQ